VAGIAGLLGGLAFAGGFAMVRGCLGCVVAALSVGWLAGGAWAADPIKLPGKIESVTVYRGQALVTRVVDVTAPAGVSEVTITDLPDRIIPGSVYAESSDGVAIHSVRYQEYPVQQDIRAGVKTLDDQIRADQDALDADNRAGQVLAARSQYLDKLEAFTAPTATAELSKGVLDADVLKNLTTFVFEQRKAISDASLDLSRKDRDARDSLTLHTRQRNELAGGSTKTARDASVLVEFKNAGGQLRVHYLVDQADWTASYIAHGDPKQQTVSLEYDASVRQMSGEDWPDVNMTLSTATPSLVATAPQLDPLEIALQSVPLVQAEQQLAAAGEYDEERKFLEQAQADAEVLRNGPVAANSASSIGSGGGTIGRGARAGRGGAGAGGAAGAPGGAGASSFGNLGGYGGMGGGSAGGYVTDGTIGLGYATTRPSQVFDRMEVQQKALDQNLKDVSRQLQELELVAQAAKPQTPNEGHQSVAVTYNIPRTTLPSRADEQLIQISTLALKGTFYKTAMPVLTSFIYNQANVVNNGKIVLLAGPVSSYDSDHFVGIGQLPTVATGESFTLGFGIDATLRASRELVEKTDALQAGNRVLNFNYKLSIENFGSDPAVVRLMDRVPTTKATEAKITLGAASRELSTDGQYVATDKNKGILRWDVTIPAQAIGDKAVTVDHQFKVEYDKQLSISATSFTGR